MVHAITDVLSTTLAHAGGLAPDDNAVHDFFQLIYLGLVVIGLGSMLPYVFAATIVATVWCVIELRRRGTPRFSLWRFTFASGLASILALLTLVMGLCRHIGPHQPDPRGQDTFLPKPGSFGPKYFR
jgi:hypothetical protein